jgi:Uma2 family endonuclease
MQPRTTGIMLDPEREYELVDGQPEEKDMGGARHGRVGARLIAWMLNHVEARKLGAVYGPDTTFQIGQNQRLPDVSFVSAARIPVDGDPEGIWPIAPDLAVEVISPNDLFDKVMSKVEEYFAAGVRQVWLVSPERRTVTIYDSPASSTRLSEQDELRSERILPGFQFRIMDLFALPARSSSAETR